MTRHAPRSSALRVALVAALVVSASAQSADAPCAAERLERLPRLCEPREAAPGRDASCCAELAALNDARCFCGESIARLSGEAQRALVPPLAAAQTSCGVNPRVGELCASLAEEKTRNPPPPRAPFAQPLVLAPAPDPARAVSNPEAPSPRPAALATSQTPAACDAAHLNGRAPSKYENFVDAGVAVGGKTTIGPGCVVARDVVLGEKCSVKRSVVARGASVGTGVKLVNSVVMPRASVEDGVSLNGCVVGPRAVIGAGSSLRECLVGAEYEVEEGDDVRAETLSSKAR